MVRVALVEDEESSRKKALSFMNRYQDEKHVAIEPFFFSNGLNFIEEYKGGFDLVFLDVAMPQMTGLEAAKKLREKDSNVVLIFVTSLAQYAIKGYEVNAFDYLIKPLDYDLFRIKMDKALNFILSKQDRQYAVMTPTGMRRLDYSDTMFVEAEQHYLLFHTTNETVRVRKLMRDILPEFESKGFALIRKSVLVNLTYVDFFQGNEIRVGEFTLPLARAYKEDFLKKLATAVGKEV